MKGRTIITTMMTLLTLIAISAALASAELPEDVREALRIGLAAEERQEWDTAIRYFSEAQRKAPHHPAVLFYLGRVHGKAQNPIPAIIWLRAYLAAAPGLPNAMVEKIEEEIARQKVLAMTAIRELRDRAVMLWKERGDMRDVDIIRLRAIAEAQANFRDFGGVVETARAMDKLGRASEFKGLFEDFVTTLINAGDIRNASEVISMAKRATYGLPSGYSKAMRLRDIAKKEIQTGKLLEARETLKDAKKETAALKSGPLSDLLFLDIIKLQLKADDTEGALLGFKDFLNKALGRIEKSSQIFRSIVEFQAMTGDFTGARQTIAQFRDKDEGFEIHALIIIAEELFKRGEKVQGLQALQEAQSIAVGLWKRTRDYGYMLPESQPIAKVLQAQLQAKDSAGAKETASQADFSWMWLKMAEVQLESGDRSGARESLEVAIRGRKYDDYWLRLLLGREYDDYWLHLLLDGARLQVKLGAMDEARQTLAKALDIAKKAEDLSNLARIALYQADMGDETEAKRTIELVHELSSRKNTDFDLSLLAEAQAKVGDFAGARETLEKTLHWTSRDFDRFKNIAEIQATKDDRNGALQTLALVEPDDWLYLVESAKYLRSLGLADESHDIAFYKAAFDLKRYIKETERMTPAEVPQALLGGAYRLAEMMFLIHKRETRWREIKGKAKSQ